VGSPLPFEAVADDYARVAAELLDLPNETVR
jgi:hypothetical protein